MMRPLARVRSSLPVGRALLATIAAATLAACASAPAPAVPAPATPARVADSAPSSSEALVRAMYARYAGKWYRTLTFRQTTTLYTPGGTSVQHWYEAGMIPGRLRIETDTMRRGGVIYAGDSVYQFANGALAHADTGVNPLMLLGFDVYGQPPATTIAQLRRRGVDLSKFSRATWEGRPAFVVGAAAGDTTSLQFWVDAERLLFVRLIEPRVSPSGTHHTDARFMKYAPYGGGWVAEQVMLFVDGRQRLTEEYSDVRVDVPLAPAVFDPPQWSTSPRIVVP